MVNLTNIDIRLSNIEEDANYSADSLNGEKSYSFTPKDKALPVRGFVNAKAGTLDVSKEIFLLPVTPLAPTPADPEPSKTVTNLNSRVIASRGHWRDQQRNWHDRLMHCPSQSNSELALITPMRPPVRLAAQRRGVCAERDWCDSSVEYCIEEKIVDQGCTVNTAWMEWHRRQLAKNGVAYAPSAAVCAP